MLNLTKDLSFSIKENIRTIDFDGLTIGGDASLSFMSENQNIAKPLVAIEIPYKYDKSFPDILKQKWEATSFLDLFEKAMKSDADIVSIRFNIEEQDVKSELNNIKIFLLSLNQIETKPLILRGSNNVNVDRILLPFLAENAPKAVIIAFADEDTYETIVPAVVKNNHVLVLRTPIDINLAKELNVLSSDKGLSLDKILIDSDMGGLGYGLEYGYSIVEKIRLAGFAGDSMLNMPIIAFIGEESYRAKESKLDTFSTNWGTLDKRASMWELSGAAAMISAGANIVVVWNPQSIGVLKGLL